MLGFVDPLQEATMNVLVPTRAPRNHSQATGSERTTSALTPRTAALWLALGGGHRGSPRRATALYRRQGRVRVPDRPALQRARHLAPAGRPVHRVDRSADEGHPPAGRHPGDRLQPRLGARVEQRGTARALVPQPVHRACRAQQPGRPYRHERRPPPPSAPHRRFRRLTPSLRIRA